MTDIQPISGAVDRALQSMNARPATRTLTFAEQEAKERFATLWREARPPDRQANKPPSADGAWGDCLRSCLPRLGTGFLIGLIGLRGTGKTQLAVELIRATCKADRTAKYTRTAEFFMDVKASYDSDGKMTERDVIEAHERPKLLVLDEAHERGDTPWASSLLNLLIDRRYAAMKDTVLIANMEKPDFLASIGPSIASRMTETGGVIECKWASYR